MTITRGKNLTSKETARLLSVSEASVKRWADSGLLPAARTAGGHRRFRPEDIALFKRAGFGEVRSRAIKRQQPARRTENSVATKASSIGSKATLIEETFHALLDGHTEELSALLVNLHLHGQTVASIADHYLCPPMHRVGDLWHKGEMTVAQEHVATRTAISALRNLQAVMDTSEKKMLALCCSVEDDFHELPVQLAALTLEARGLEVLNMGTSTPFFALTEALERFRPGLICVASTVLNSMERAARDYAEFHKAARRARARVVMGGAGFADAEVRRRLPAELHAESFRQLDKFISSRVFAPASKRAGSKGSHGPR